MIKPLEDRIVIEPDKQEVTKGGIIIPLALQESHTQGTVVAVGPGRDRPVSVSVGDRVLFNHMNAISMTIDDKSIKIVRSPDIFAIV
jgi:chaperonin GroES